MPKIAIDTRRLPRPLAAREAELNVPVTTLLEVSGWVELRRNYQEQGHWTLQKQLPGLMR